MMNSSIHHLRKESRDRAPALRDQGQSLQGTRAPRAHPRAGAARRGRRGARLRPDRGDRARAVEPVPAPRRPAPLRAGRVGSPGRPGAVPAGVAPGRRAAARVPPAARRDAPDHAAADRGHPPGAGRRGRAGRAVTGWRSLLPGRRDYADLPRTWRADLLAGLTVGIVALPLALAFGVSSGAGAEAGLVTAVVAGLVAALFGGSPVQVSGPTGAMVVVLAPIVAAHGAGALGVVCLLAGTLVVLAGVLRLGRLVGMIPWPVIEGFTLGIAVIIFLQQVPSALGVDAAGHDANAAVAAVQALGEASPATAAWSLGAVAVVALVMAVAPRVHHALPGSIVAIVVVTLGAVLLHLPLATIGRLPAGLPAPAHPAGGRGARGAAPRRRGRRRRRRRADPARGPRGRPDGDGGAHGAGVHGDRGGPVQPPGRAAVRADGGRHGRRRPHLRGRDRRRRGGGPHPADRGALGGDPARGATRPAAGGR